MCFYQDGSTLGSEYDGGMSGHVSARYLAGGDRKAWNVTGLGFVLAGKQCEAIEWRQRWSWAGDRTMRKAQQQRKRIRVGTCRTQGTRVVVFTMYVTLCFYAMMCP